MKSDFQPPRKIFPLSSANRSLDRLGQHLRESRPSSRQRSIYDTAGAGLDKGEEEDEDVGGSGQDVGGAVGSFEFGLGCSQAISSGLFEGAVELAEGPVHLRHDLAAKGQCLTALFFIVC